MDDLNLDLDNIEVETEEKLKVKDRFAKLSEKISVTAREKEEVEAKLKALTEAQSNVEKERDFFKDFSSNATKYPSANEYQDKIFEKVKGGYSTEDAIITVLAKEGKLPTMPTIEASHDVAGGSAQTNLGDGGNKDLASMTMAEKLNALQDLEKRGGISL